MKTTILVPVDFTPVSLNALNYACELSQIHETEIVAVHLLDNKLLAEMHEQAGHSEVMQKMMERMHDERVHKTTSDLSNFVSDLKEKYGDIIRPHLTPGSIYEAFNDIAAKYESSLIVMGTHGIIGMQHLAGSRAYKVVLNTSIPFLVVQNKRYKPINTIYFAFRDAEQFHAYAGHVSRLSHYFPGKFIINIIAGDSNTVPASLDHIADRITIKNRKLNHINVIASATTEGADAVCISINEIDNIDTDIYGMTQDKILANRHEFPILCLPQI